jgi:hypothetical protein
VRGGDFSTRRFKAMGFSYFRPYALVFGLVVFLWVERLLRSG